MRKSRSNIIAIGLIVIALILVGVTVFIARQIASRNVNPDDTSAEVREVRSTKVKDLIGKRSGRLDVINGSTLVAAVASDTNNSLSSSTDGTTWSNTATLKSCTDANDTDDNRVITPQRVVGRLSGVPSSTANEVILSGWTYGVVAAINMTTGACRDIDGRSVIWGDHFETSYGVGNYTFPNSGGTAFYASTGGRRGTEPSFRPIHVSNRTDGTGTNGQALKRGQVDGNDDYSFGPGVYVGNGKFVVSYNALNSGKTMVIGPVQDITSSALSGPPPFTMVAGAPDIYVLDVEASTSGPSTAWVVGRGPSNNRAIASHTGHLYGVDPANNTVRTKYEFPELAGYAARPSGVVQVGTRLVVSFGLGNDDTENVRGGIVVCNLSASNTITGCSRMLDVPNAELVLDVAYFKNQYYALGAVTGGNSAVFRITLVDVIATVTVTQPTATATVTQPTATATATVTVTASPTATTTVTVPTASASPTATTTTTVTPTTTTTGQASPTPTDTPTTTPTDTVTPTDTATTTPTDDPGTGTPTATPSELPGTAVSIEIWGYIAAITFFVTAGAIFSWDLLHKRRR